MCPNNNKNYLYLIAMSLFLGGMCQFVLLGKLSFSLLINGAMFYGLFLFPVFRTLLLIFGVVLSLLLPLSLVTGGLLQPSLIDVVVSTNINESYQFYLSLPFHYIFVSMCLLLFFTMTIFYRKKLVIRKSKKISLIAIIMIFTFAFIFVSKNIKILTRMKDAYYSIYSIEKKIDSWQVLGKSNNKTYNTYVVIIGESMRKDFMSLYKFPLKTTPFIDSLPKKYITNYISTAVNTTLSVPRVLSKSDQSGAIQAENNAINLAKKAGYYTYWISSQGLTGQYNTAASIIAKDADYSFFKAGDDNDLLFKIKDKINEPKNKKIIFVHIMGSHEYPCERLYDYGIKYNSDKGETINCYLSTYNKTDEFIKQIFQYLRESNNSFSVSYFSDHGLNFIKESNDYKFLRKDNIKQSYQIPFFVASSDDLSSEEINVVRSAYNYLDFFASWIGVKTNLTKDNYNIFSNVNDKPLVMSYDMKLKSYSEKDEGIAADDLF